MSWRERGPRGDSGQLSLLVLGYLVLAFSQVTVVVDATAVHLARTQLLDAADAAALDAADALDGSDIYGSGLPGRPALPVTDEAVRRQARTYLDHYPPPRRLDQVRLDGDTGTSDGASATVVLTGRVRLPIAAWVVASFSDGITVSVSSTASARLTAH